MGHPAFRRLPDHIGVIPDGNRRWAEEGGMTKQEGYAHGIPAGFQMFETCLELGIKELSFYGFTQDNTKRPVAQRLAFQQACVNAVRLLRERDADLLVVGNTRSGMFPEELRPYARRVRFGKGLIKVNFLVNYAWQWDLAQAFSKGAPVNKGEITALLGSAEISRIDLVIRWGGRRRLSGFLPVQTVYADFYIVDALWPEYEDQQLYEALAWYQDQDITLGG